MRSNAVTDYQIKEIIRETAVETLREVKNAVGMTKEEYAQRYAETIKMDGKEYRCVRPPRSEADYGQWEFFYNGKWHEVLNYGVRKQLNEKLKK